MKEIKSSVQKSQKMASQQHQHQSTSKKRLLSTHQKPEERSKSEPGPPIVPADDQLLLPAKKTRDLPNLSDCHGCGLHINHTNPKDRLQTLDSVWRIVLLCRKCIKRVELGQTCPYCFKESAKAECFQCRDCERLIHKSCAFHCSYSPPWSLCASELGLGFMVCVDCWVPKLFRKSIRIRRRKKNCGGSKELGLVDSEGPKNGGRTQQDANCLAGREIVLALKALWKGSTKSEVQKKVELENGAVKVVVKKGKDGEKTEGLDRKNSISSKKCSKDTSVNKVVDDAELAFQLHRAINSSSRNLKNLCSLNSGCLDVFSRLRDESGSSFEVGRLKPRLLTYKRRKPKKELITYKRGCLKRKRFLENDDAGSSVGVFGKKPHDDSEMNSGSCSSMWGELRRDQLNGADVVSLVNCDGNDAKQQATCGEKADYTPENRDVGSSIGVGKKPVVGREMNCGSCASQQGELNCDQLSGGDVANLMKCDDSIDTRHGAICSEKADRCLIKYSRRKGCKVLSNPGTRITNETSPNADQAPALKCL